MGPQSEGWLSAFLNAIPNAATSPLALVAYLATLAAWFAISWRVRRLSVLLQKIKDVPEPDRIKILTIEMGHIEIPGGMTAKEYLRLRQKTFLFYGYLATCVTIILLVVLTGYSAYDKKKRADELTEHILGAPSSQYMSSVNVLASGEAAILQLKTQLPPQPTQAQLADEANQMVLNGIRSAEEIARRLGEKYGGGLIQKANRILNGAAEVVDSAYDDLANCYREQQCSPGSRLADMCKSVQAIKRTIDRANEAARSIPGVMINKSGSPPNFGSGTMDLYFEELGAPNIKYLSDRVCGEAP